MKIKQTIRKMLPEKFIDLYYLKKIEAHKKNNYNKIESEINKRYKELYDKGIDWNKPKTYTEKMNVSKVYGFNNQKTMLTDKISVRDWVKEKIGEEYLIPLYGVYDKFEEIDFESLPNEFVIKCNHDSGSATLCNDKKSLNIDKIKSKYHFYLKRNYAYWEYEMHYKDIKPKIMIEKYMGDTISDYKFLCFNGKPYYCWVDVDRFGNHKRNIYDLNWKLQPFNQFHYGNYEKELECPKQFEKMKEIAEKLCKGFDHVRVDLYVIDEKVYFGEMTFTNGSGFEAITPEEYDYELGQLWEFNNKREEILKTTKK